MLYWLVFLICQESNPGYHTTELTCASGLISVAQVYQAVCSGRTEFVVSTRFICTRYFFHLSICAFSSSVAINESILLFPVHSTSEQSHSPVHDSPLPFRHAQHHHTVEEDFVGFLLRSQRIVVHPVVDNGRFGVFAVGWQERPEDTRHAGEVGDESGRYADNIAVIVAQVKLKGFMYPPQVMVQHFQNGGCGEFAH